MSVERTFVIVDLAGFTAASEVHGDETAADLATQLTDLATAALGSADRLVKSIGDAVLVACTEPRAAVGFIRRLFTSASEVSGLPLLRAGAHHGPAVERGGDVFGTAVNVASRVAALAPGGHVLATAAVADAARAVGAEVVDLGEYPLRNLSEPFRVFELVLHTGGEGQVVDPVCRMRIDRARAVGRVRHRGRQHWLCSLECAAAFTAAPDRYAGPD